MEWILVDLTVKKQNKLILTTIGLAAVFQICGCTSSALVDRDFKTSMWEELWLEGTDALEEKRYVDARRILEQATKEVRGTHNNMRLGVSLDRLADSYLASDMDKEAQKSYEEAIDVFDQSIKNDRDVTTEKVARREQIGSLSSLAQLLVKKKKFQAAEKLIERALSNAQFLGGTSMKETNDKLLVMDFGTCLQTLGKIYESTNRESEARATYVKASEYMADLNMGDADSDLLQMVVKNKDAEGSQMSGDEIRQLNALIQKWTPLQNEGKVLHQEGKFAEARDSFQKAYVLARAFNPSCDQAMDSLTQLLKMRNKLREFDEAEKLVAANLPLIEKSPPTKAMDNALGEMAKVFMNQKQWHESEKLLKLRVKFRETIRGDNNFHVAETLYELANVYLESNNLPQAEFCLRKAQKILDYNNISDKTLNTRIATAMARLDELRDAGKHQKKLSR